MKTAEKESGLMANINKDPLLRRKQAAEYLGIKACTLAAWESRGKFADLKPIKVGKIKLYPLSMLEQFVANRKAESE